MRYATPAHVEAALNGMGLRIVPPEEQTAGFLASMGAISAMSPMISLPQPDGSKLHLGPAHRLRLVEYHARLRALYNGRWYSNEYTRADVRAMLEALGCVIDTAGPGPEIIDDPVSPGFVSWMPAVDLPPIAGMDIWQRDGQAGKEVLIRYAFLDRVEGEVWHAPAPAPEVSDGIQS